MTNEDKKEHLSRDVVAERDLCVDIRSPLGTTAFTAPTTNKVALFQYPRILVEYDQWCL